jgi:hypothetical protein
VLTEEKFDDTGARAETSPTKSLVQLLVQETGVLRKSAQRAKKLLKLRPYKATILHALKEHDPLVKKM